MSALPADIGYESADCADRMREIWPLAEGERLIARAKALMADLMSAGCKSEAGYLEDVVSDLTARFGDDPTSREEARIETCRERGVDPYGY